MYEEDPFDLEYLLGILRDELKEELVRLKVKLEEKLKGVSLYDIGDKGVKIKNGYNVYFEGIKNTFKLNKEDDYEVFGVYLDDYIETGIYIREYKDGFIKEFVERGEIYRVDNDINVCIRYFEDDYIVAEIKGNDITGKNVYRETKDSLAKVAVKYIYEENFIDGDVSVLFGTEEEWDTNFS